MRRDRQTAGRTLSAARPAALSRRRLLAALAAASLAPITGCTREARPTTARFAQFGTLVDITIWDAGARDAERAINALRRAYAALDRDWYAWGDGELGAINAALSRGVVVPVTPALGDLLRHALTLSYESGGLFDMRMGPLVELWGFAGTLTATAALPDDAAIAEALARARLQVEVHNDAAGWRVRSEAAGVLLDLGGIAKGAVLSQGIATLRREGIRHAVIDAGGDLAAFDDGGQREFRVGIQPARNGDPRRALTLNSGETVTTSGDYARYREFGGQRYAHIIDPRTGWPSAQARSATVVHRDPARADAAATALIVGGSDLFDNVCDAMRVETALLVDNRGQVQLTADMRARLDTGQPR